MEDPATIDTRTADRATAMAATNFIQELMYLETIIKAWPDLWTAVGQNSYGVERGKPHTFMNPNAQQWDDIRSNPTIREAVRNGIALNLADSPAQVSERFQAMINNGQPELDARQDAKRANCLPEGSTRSPSHPARPQAGAPRPLSYASLGVDTESLSTIFSNTSLGCAGPLNCRRRVLGLRDHQVIREKNRHEEVHDQRWN